MLYLVASLCLQVICAVHVIRTGRSQLWLMVIFFLSVLGCFAYAMIEVMPDYWGNRHVRNARSKAVKKIAPDRMLKAAQERLDMADTAANRTELGDALADLGRHAEAAAEYRIAIERGPGSDWPTILKLAQALFESGDSAAALRQLESIPAAGAAGDGDRRALLQARIFADLGRAGEARSLFEDVVTRIPGESARCYYAAFLLEQGDRLRARQMLEEVEARMKKLDRLQRAREADMYAWAGERLAELRAA